MDLNSNKILMKNSNISTTDDIFVEKCINKFIVYKNDIVYTTLYPKTMFEKILYGSCVNFNHNIRVMYDILGNVLYNLRLHGYEYNFLNGVEFEYVDFEKCLKDDISKKHNIDYKHDTIVTLKNAKYYTIVYTYNNISYNCICDFTGKIYDNYFGYSNVDEMIKDLEYNEKLKHNMNFIETFLEEK